MTDRSCLDFTPFHPLTFSFSVSFLHTLFLSIVISVLLCLLSNIGSPLSFSLCFPLLPLCVSVFFFRFSLSLSLHSFSPLSFLGHRLCSSLSLRQSLFFSFPVGFSFLVFFLSSFIHSIIHPLFSPFSFRFVLLESQIDRIGPDLTWNLVRVYAGIFQHTPDPSSACSRSDLSRPFWFHPAKRSYLRPAGLECSCHLGPKSIPVYALQYNEHVVKEARRNK